MPETVSECVICGHRNYTLDAAGTYLLNLPEPFNVIRCGRCDFRWLSPRPTAEEYVELVRPFKFPTFPPDLPDRPQSRPSLLPP